MNTLATSRAHAGSVTDDTVERVNEASRHAGFDGWQEVVRGAQQGRIFSVEFAARRPESFVREFAALLREAGLRFTADSCLDLFMGTNDALDRFVRNRAGFAISRIDQLGLVPESDVVTALAGASRSAGIRQTPSKRVGKLAGVKVLILDDDEVSRKVLSAALQREGCSVRTAADAESAFAVLRESPPHLVVLDIVLGGSLDGVDFCRAMHSNSALSDIPAIFVSGHPQSQSRVCGAGIDPAQYFTKPVRSASLCTAVMNLVQARHAILGH
ncbi:response regulator with CheY-like receiver, AAA-type ATPase, and DNA-binding domains [Burkholderia sp. Ch1-1]|uniref:response regulator n=1 Tax=Paraburkholderia sp. USG1 TaxID=2952268 RepID=UPI0001D2192D|nr:response regulator [Paraburkholderia sp. USG1]EIF34919.1 response regulator with CheY-like receiver, AAA-type ATPase, and DNA-binding domains [Burkholderia sp. Ch1-1]MDR8396521.1 response regulator [Paraburkholderia sp. USG1]